MKTKLLLVNLLFAFTAFSQDPPPPLPQVIPASPQAMELIKHINYPVDLSNGLVKIEIPIYEVRSGDITLPISLSYHASGLKVNQHSDGWIGDGWMLNTGPRVSRRVIGLPDEQYQIYSNTTAINNAVATGSIDVALDEYYYSTLNNSGKFVIKRYSGWNKKAILLPYAPVSIEPVGFADPGVNQIVDNLGYIYTFSSPADQTFDQSLNRYVLNSWKVSSIASKNTNSKIDFTYTTPVTRSLPEAPVDYIKILDNPSFNFGFPLLNWGDGIGAGRLPIVLKRDATTAYPQFFEIDPGTGAVDTEETFVSDFPTSVWDNYNATITSYNKEILFQGGKIEFERNTVGLAVIKIFADNDFVTPVKTIKFHQHQELPFEEDRLRLDSISFFGKELVTPSVYRFSYNPYVAGPSESRSIDLWGYLNNAPEYQSTLIPSFSIERGSAPNGNVEISFPGANRESDEEKMQWSILESIKYPSGAETKFYYEAHRVIGDTTAFQLTGGLRIRQIQTIDKQKSKYFRNFRYGDAWNNKESGLGVRQFAEGDIFSIANHSYRKEFWIYSPDEEIMRPIYETTYACNPLVNLFSESGSSVVYPFVTEYQSKDSTNNEHIGRTEYKFNINPPTTWRYPGTNINVEYFDGWKSGEQITKSVYKNGMSQPIEKDTSVFYLQETYNPDSIVTQTYVFKDREFLGKDENMVPAYDRLFTVYQNNIVTGRKRAVLSNKTVYTGAGAIENSESFSYDRYGNLRATNRVNSDGSSNASIVKYPRDMVTESRDPNGVYQDMVDNNMVSVPVENITEKDNDFIQKSYTGYSKPFGTFFSPTEIRTKTKGHNEETRLKFNQYDSRGNILEQQKADGVKEVYLWGYNSQYPVAKIVGSDFATVDLVVDTALINSSSATPVQIRTELQKLRTDSRTKDAFVTSYTYQPLVGITSETDPKGMVTYYEYDTLQRLENIKDHNGDIIKNFKYNYRP